MGEDKGEKGKSGKKIRKALLLFPPMRCYPISPRSIMPPTGLLHLAAMVRDICQVRVLDAAAEGFDHIRPFDAETFTFGLSENEILARVREFGPDLVGISCIFSICYPVVSKIARAIKKENKDISVVIGGNHPTFLAREILEQEPAIDFVVLGEGEWSFKELIRELNGKRNFGAIDGLAFRRGSQVTVRERTRFDQDLDALPLPAWDLVDLPLYEGICLNAEFFLPGKGPHATISFSRGCPHRCAFCATSKFMGHSRRQRSIPSVLDEMEMLKNRFGVRRFTFTDDNMLGDKSHGMEFIQSLIDRDLGITWHPEGIGLWHLDEEIVPLLKKSGCTSFYLSMESCSKAILKKYVQKPVSLEHIQKLVTLLNDHRFNYFVNLMMGFPEETKQTLAETVDFLKQVGDTSVVINMAAPFPGTRLARECLDSGCLEPGFDFANLNYMRSFIRTRDFSGKEMTHYIGRQNVLLNLYFMRKYPLSFLKRYWRLAKNPLMRKEMLRIHWNKFFGFL